MQVRWILIYFMVLFVSIQATEAGKLNRIQKLIQKEKLEKAEKVIHKVLEKNQISPGAKYFYSVLFSDTSFYKFNIDSAHYYIKSAQKDYDASPVDDLKDLRKVDLTPIDFERQKSFVTTLAFGRASDEMTLEAMLRFLADYPQAEQTEKAIGYRDSLAYELVLAENTWQAYKTYFETYPQSEYVEEATERYQVLIFKDYTKEDNLDGYIRFLEDHPNTPFRKEAEEIILVRSTLDNQWNSYTFFLDKYPKTHLRKRIGDLMYYHALQNGRHEWEEVLKFHVAADSLKKMHELNEKILFPIADLGSYGFMSLQGEIVVPVGFANVPDRYLCGNIHELWLEVGLEGGSQALLRSGEVILSNIRDLEEVGHSAILAQGENSGLYHKSGFMISDRSIEEATELNNGWIAFSERERWGLVTPAGFEILAPELESIRTEGAFFVLQKEGSFAITNAEELMQEHYQLAYLFDDYEVINDTLVQAYQKERECLINRDLDYLRPLQEETIYVNNSFWYQKGQDGYEIFDIDDQEIIGENFDYLEVNEGWLTLKRESKWLLISRKLGGVQPIRDLDSVKLINDATIFAKKGDTLQLIFQNGRREWIQPDVVVQLLSGDEQEYILLSSKGFQEVFDHEGNPLFNSRYDQVSFLTDSLFKFKVKGKYGAIDQTGKVLIPGKYNVIDQNDDLLFLLSDKQIGCYDLKINTLIPAQYEARVVKIGDYYKVQIEGKVGLIDAQAKEMVPAVYQEMVHWNDTALWAQGADYWQIISFSGEVLKSGVLFFETWIEGPEELYALILEEEGHGLLSNQRGEVLASEYNEIINLGTNDQPVIFAEQHLKAAAFYVVTYFDIVGTVLRSQAFRPEEYTEIYCDQ